MEILMSALIVQVWPSNCVGELAAGQVDHAFTYFSVFFLHFN